MNLFDKIVVITGGIGSGKSHISKIFESHGIPVFNSDKCAKEIMNHDSFIIEEIINIFGNQIFKDNKVDAIKLGDEIFADKEKKDMLENLVHPAVISEMLYWAYQQIFKENHKFVIVENAILTQSAFFKCFKKAIFVDAPMHFREERIMKRSGMTLEKMENIILSQDFPILILDKLEQEGIQVIPIVNDESGNIEDDVCKIIEALNK